MADFGPCGSLGQFTNVLITSNGGTFSNTSERLLILAEDLSRNEPLMPGEALTGRIDLSASTQRYGPRLMRGRLVAYVSPLTMSTWLPRLLGSTFSADTINMVQVPTFVPFDVLVKRDYNVYRYNKMYVDYMLIEGRSQLEGEDPMYLRVVFGLIGKTEVLTQTYPSPAPGFPDPLQPQWLLADSTLTLGADTVPVEGFRLIVQNNLIPFHRNNLEADCFRSAGRRVTFQLDIPHNDETKTLYNTPFSGTGEFTFLGTKNLGGSNAAETTFTFPYLINERKTPETRGRGETLQPLSLQAKIDPDDDTAYVMTVTNVLES